MTWIRPGPGSAVPCPELPATIARGGDVCRIRFVRHEP